MKETIIGIDLGTSSCCISYIKENGIMEIIRDELYPDKITIPSIISIEEKGILVGNEINSKHINSNKNIFHSFKRLIGHSLNDINTTNISKILNYNIIEVDGKILCVDTNNKLYHLEEIIYFLLSKIKTIIINKFGKFGWSCIVTIPAYFNEIQRQITLDAIKICNLPLIKLLNEPTAASFAYLYHNKVLYQEKFNKKIIVIDFGAGTLDLTIIDICKEDELVCEVLGIYGDNNFGGIDITQIIYNNLFENNFESIDINTKFKIAEDIKIQLSNGIDVTYFSNELEYTFNYKYKFFINQLEKYFDQKMLFTIDQVLNCAKLNKNDIDEIILVGGSFKIPYFRLLISKYFDKQIESITLKVDNQTFLLYEDIAVSLGASIYGYYNSRNEDIILIEKLPLSIGIESSDGQIIKVIERNTNIPITKTKTFTTETFEQTDVTISIYQGESVFKENCVLIGTFTLKNLPPNKPVIFVSIRVDLNGIISVTAKDKRSYTENTIQIDLESSKLSQEKIDELLNKYENNKLIEKQYKKLINSYYQLITIIDKISYQINFNFMILEKNIKDIIYEDLQKVLDVMENSYIVNKYKININLLNKCSIINNLKFNIQEYNENTIMNENDIDNYIDILVKLYDFLIDKYDIFIIQNINEIKTINEIDKLENIDDTFDTFDTDDTDDINNQYSSINDLKNKNIINIDLEQDLDQDLEQDQIDYKIDDLIDLIEYLKLNINDFDISFEGKKYLLDEILNINLQNIDDINYTINYINKLCLDVKTKFSE